VGAGWRGEIEGREGRERGEGRGGRGGKGREVMGLGNYFPKTLYCIMLW